MTWVEKPAGMDPPGDVLAELWSRPEILRIPGAHTPLAGRMAKAAGFEALYVSGAAVSATLGLPDLGVMTTEEIVFFARRIRRATDLPLIVDGDTGYGEILNVMRLVRDLEEAGAAAIQIEDQVFPKKCGHLNDKRVVPTDVMCAKIEAARRARQSLRILVRTDAVSVEGLDSAIARAQAYIAAGADAIFPEALTSAEDFRKVSEALDVPLLANMTEFGRTPYLTAQQFQDFGFSMVIWPVSDLRAAARAVEGVYETLMREGTQQNILDRMQTRKDLYALIDYAGFEALDGSIAASVAPDLLAPGQRSSDDTGVEKEN